LCVFFVRDRDDAADCHKILRDGRAVSRVCILTFWWRYLEGSPNGGLKVVFGQFVRHNVKPFCHKQDSLMCGSAAFVYSAIRMMKIFGSCS